MIAILMAAYNGERYIAEQIESILNQTETGWKLTVRDDCSRDATLSVIRRYGEKHPEKIGILEAEKNSGSAKNNFFRLMEGADGDYVMFSDDDDVWLPEKIQTTLLKMKELEWNFGTDTPLLVHTDLKVADENLRVISPSLFRMQNLKGNRDRLANLLSQNIVTGCTVMANHTLIRTVLRAGIPEHAVMHDWWLALVAAGFGGIGFVDAPTVLYRQHGNNEVGAKNSGDLRYNLRRFFDPAQVRSALDGTYVQAREFYVKYGKDLEENDRAVLKAYCSIPEKSKWGRLAAIGKYGFWKTGFYRKLGQIWFS